MGKHSIQLRQRTEEIEAHFQTCVKKFGAEHAHREKLFQDFKTSTLSQVIQLYERQIDMMRRELDTSYARIEALSVEGSRWEEEMRSLEAEKRRMVLEWRARELELIGTHEGEVHLLRERLLEAERRGGQDRRRASESSLGK